MKDFSIIAVIIPRSLPCVVKSSIIWNHSMSVLTTSHLGLSLWVTPIWEYLWPWPPVMSSRTWDLDLDLESRDLDDLEQGELARGRNWLLLMTWRYAPAPGSSCLHHLCHYHCPMSLEDDDDDDDWRSQECHDDWVSGGATGSGREDQLILTETGFVTL